MQTISGAVKADIGWHNAIGGMPVNAIQISCLMDIATLAENLDQIRFIGHCAYVRYGRNYASGSKSGSVSAPSTSAASRYPATCPIIGSRWSVKK